MNLVIENSQSLIIEQPDLYLIDVKAIDAQLDLVVMNQAKVVLNYLEAKNVQVNLKLEGCANLEVLHINKGSDLNLVLNYNLGNDSVVNAGMLEISGEAANYEVNAVLANSGAQFNTINTTIASDKVHYNIKALQQAHHTIANMENYAISMEGADLYIYDEGHIFKGAYQSESHQTSRVLTLSDKQTSEVLPLLLIDENDVKASHACGIGQPDEQQLYYLQTRGLSLNQAIGLLSKGYIMPIINVISDEAYKEELSTLLIEKMENL